jgi:hypothetical protein
MKGYQASGDQRKAIRSRIVAIFRPMNMLTVSYNG